MKHGDIFGRQLLPTQQTRNYEQQKILFVWTMLSNFLNDTSCQGTCYFILSDTAKILVFMHFITKKWTRFHEEILIVVPLQETRGLDFDNGLVGFLNSSKFDVNRIMLLTVDGTPAMFTTIKERYFSASRITVCIYKLPLLDTSVRSVLKVLLILSGRTPLFTTGNTRCFW